MDGHGPLHSQLTRALKAAMLEGRMAAGERLPPTRLLARELEVSRNTVLAAYEQLQAEGFLRGKVGSGSYVAPGLQAQRAVEGERAVPPAGSRVLPPQSVHAGRLRRFHDHARIPGRTVPGTRYAFQYGVPMTNPALTSAWARELSRAARYTAPSYPPSQGLPALREAVAGYLGRRRGVQVAADDVLIVNGTQQAIALTARVLLDPGAAAAIEEPQYFAIREVLQIHGARLQPVPVDGEGLRVDMLPMPAPRLVCVTPSHQFPTGAVLSLPRRQALLDYVHAHDGWIFEDDYDGEFRYDARPLSALRSLDRRGRVVYVGSFSKAMFPALRLGYLVMPPGLREDFISAKWAEDFGSSSVEQAALARFIDDGGFERHLRRTSKALRERRAALLQGLARRLGERIEIADSNAGMHLVAWLRDATPAQGERLIATAARRGLGLHPIAPFYLQPPARQGLLMGYAGMPLAEIDAALQLFAECMDEAVPAR
ncbi:PLP-dependent aminotransferase family protein [Marilutibacter chinensis]|uniref:PLP-dependent aminotransferase family protein n=1 Tax=Marilutibacter chinensis TaxID=2912247 RepID=A0ABS9HSJ0_9GAMM|nr:PLP-dependent aminotransferase family protein [Lysobacter chinensis]MCF7221886.1 PLP-dependent aminotransferase family protein [Lysobacter chinensis]